MKPVPHSRPWLTAGDASAISAALQSGMIGQGKRTEEFEGRMAAWVGGAGGVATASGTAAVSLALRVLECGPGDDVIMPSYVCRCVLDAVLATGASPVLCDSGPEWNIEPEGVAPLVSRRTRAVIVPHLLGIFADTGRFKEMGIPIVEDFAQALGPAGAPPLVGDIGVFSFHPTKCLTTAEGGMCVSREPGLLAKLRDARSTGHASGGSRAFSPLSDLASVLGLSQLDRYPAALERRREIASRYDRAIAGGQASRGPCRRPTMHFRYPVRIPGGSPRYAPAFLERGVIVRRGIDELMHRILGLDDRGFPGAVCSFDDTVSLPIHPSMSDREVETCASAAAEIWRANPAGAGN